MLCSVSKWYNVVTPTMCCIICQFASESISFDMKCSSLNLPVLVSCRVLHILHVVPGLYLISGSPGFPHVFSGPLCNPLISISLSADFSEWQDGRVHQHPGHGVSQRCTHAHAAETQRHPTGLPSFFPIDFNQILFHALYLFIYLFYFAFLFCKTSLNSLSKTKTFLSTRAVVFPFSHFRCSMFHLLKFLLGFIFSAGLHAWIPQNQRQLLGYQGTGRPAWFCQERHRVSTQLCFPPPFNECLLFSLYYYNYPVPSRWPQKDTWAHVHQRTETVARKMKVSHVVLSAYATLPPVGRSVHPKSKVLENAESYW